MINKDTVEQTVKRFFEAIDSRNWEEFESTMADRVQIVMKTLEGESEGIKTKEEITAMWKDKFTIVYERTLHILSPIDSSIKDNKAIETVNVDSTHFLGNEKWIGIDSYVFFIEPIDDEYKITSIDFTLHMVEGDIELRQRMMANRNQ